MKTPYNQLIPNVKTSLRENYLEKHPSLHKIFSSLYLKYCSMTGFLHVLPNFYIIGVVKGGTTSLYNYLIEHPSIQPSVGKEIDYFGEYYSRGINWYRCAFPFKSHKFFVTKILKKKFLTGEATPRYFEHPGVPEKIKKVTPNAKFILLLRNPIDRAYSHYNMNVTRGDETLSFSDAIDMEQERTSKGFKKMLNDENYFTWNYYLHAYLNHGIYIEKLKHWMDIFPRANFFILKSEDFSNDIPKYYNKVLNFLGLSSLNLKHYKMYKKRHYDEPKMDPELRKNLGEFFKPHNEQLYKFLGVDFGWN